MVDELTQESFQTGKAIVTVSIDLITAWKINFVEVKLSLTLYCISMK